MEQEKSQVRESQLHALQEAKGIVSEANEHAASHLADVQKRAETIVEDAKAQASLQMSQLVMEPKNLERERNDFQHEMELRRASIEQEMLASFEEKYKSMDSQWKQREAMLIQQEVKNAKMQTA